MSEVIKVLGMFIIGVLSVVLAILGGAAIEYNDSSRGMATGIIIASVLLMIFVVMIGAS